MLFFAPRSLFTTQKALSAQFANHGPKPVNAIIPGLDLRAGRPGRSAGVQHCRQRDQRFSTQLREASLRLKHSKDHRELSIAATIALVEAVPLRYLPHVLAVKIRKLLWTATRAVTGPLHALICTMMTPHKTLRQDQRYLPI